MLDSDDLRVYELIWKRTMASQMVDARVLRTTVEISAKARNGETAAFTASGKAIEFAGFRRAYVEGSDDPAAELEEQETILPQCQVGDSIRRRDGSARLSLVDTEPKRHETTPPARFTEASLIKELERPASAGPRPTRPRSPPSCGAAMCSGSGRRSCRASPRSPSRGCCASTSATTWTSDFTAEMEDDLDEISQGEREWIDFLREFYCGDGKHHGLDAAVEHGAEKADYPVLDVGADPESGVPVRVRIGRFGPFVQLGEGGAGRTASLPEESLRRT